MNTVGGALHGRRNALNSVRLLLASLVVFAHAAPITGHGVAPQWRGVDLGEAAVAGFFVLSGYLIAGSRVRTGLLTCLRHRFLRILPAYWTVLVVTAFVLAPVSTLWTGNPWSGTDAVVHVVLNAGLWVWQWDVGSTLAGLPLEAWNGSLWTLSCEFAAYLAVGVLFSLPAVRRHPAAWSGVLAVLAPVTLLLARGPLEVTTNVYLAGLPLAYLLLYAGAVSPWRVGSVNDVSYGMYIYAFPIEQLLVVLGFGALPNVAFGCLALVLTVPFAHASWRLVERPAMRLGRRARARPVLVAA